MLWDEAGSYIPNFRFVLRVDGMFDVPLKSVRAFTRENEYDYIQEGGLNDYVHIKRKPISKPYTLVVERYIPTEFDDPLSNGVELTLPLMLFVGRNTGGDMGALSFARYYVFTGAVVMSKEYGQLDAEHAGLLTETMTIGYNMMFCVTNPVDESDTPAWKFNVGDGDTGAAGNTKQLYSKTGNDPLQNMMNEKAFIKSANLWQFKDKDKAGKGTLSAARKKEDSKKDFFDRKREYNFAEENNKNSKGNGNSVKSAQNSLYSSKTLGDELGIKEETKEELSKKARKFKLTTASDKAGNKQLSSQRNDDTREPSQKDMTEKATKWEFDEKKKAGNEKQHSQNALVTEHTEAPDGSSTGLGLKEYTKEEMASKASMWVFDGKKVNEPVKEDFAKESRKWEFDEDNPKDKEGNKVRSRQNAQTINGEDGTPEHSGIGKTEVSKDQLASAAHKWEFTDQYTKDGNGVQSGARPEEIQESSQAELAKNARRWEFADQTKDGSGTRSRQNAQIQEAGDEASVSGMGVVELTKEDMEAGAARWKFTDKNSKAGGGTASRTRNEEESKKELSDKSKKKESIKKPASTQPEARKWSFDKKGEGTKAGEGEASRAKPRNEELTKDEMAAKAVKHVYKSITDFLMG